jgi:hypothetical protein
MLTVNSQRLERARHSPLVEPGRELFPEFTTTIHRNPREIRGFREGGQQETPASAPVRALTALTTHS